MLYEILLFAHVLGAVFWVGAGGVFQIMTERAAKTGDASQMKSMIEAGSLVPPAYFGLLTALVLISGIWMVADSGIGFEQPFVVAGIVGILASGAIGGAVIGKTVKSLRVLVDSQSFDEQRLKAGLVRLRTFGRLDLAIMVFVIYMMTVKPGS